MVKKATVNRRKLGTAAHHLLSAKSLKSSCANVKPSVPQLIKVPLFHLIPMANPKSSFFTFNHLTIYLILLLLSHSPQIQSTCRNFCNNIPINYPFSIDDGCGAPQYRHMLNCSVTDLFFLTPSGNYKVQSIDYEKQTMTIFDPSMSTCSILQPHHDFKMSEIQSAIIPPTPDTIFILVNCSIDSPVLNHYKSACFNFSGHSCDELYGSCTSFKLFHLLSNSTPACCFTGYETVKYMSMDILDCTHYTSVYNTDRLEGVGPLDWLYGMKLSFSVPNTGCARCAKSGGTCGFDVETEMAQCICSSTSNSTRDCAGGREISFADSYRASSFSRLHLLYILALVAISFNILLR